MCYNYTIREPFMTKVLFLILAGFLLAPLPARAACNFHNISGYIWSANIGYISLSCNNQGGAVDYGADIDFDSPAPSVPVTGYGWSPHAGWINFQPAGPYPYAIAPANTAYFTRNEGEAATSTVGVITGWAKLESWGANGWMKLGPLDIGGTDYGVKVGASRAFSGWSWNGADSYPAAGWVHWGNTDGGYGGAVVARWFETLYGDIYSGGNIDAQFAPPAGRYNATYLIQADGMIDPVTITSGPNPGAIGRAPGFGSLALPQAANNYKGTLGSIDRAGILNGYYGAITTYGGSNNTSTTLGNNLVLDGKIYHFTGDLTVDADLTFNKGSGSQKGSGLIMVDGNLIINADILYQSGAVAGRIDNLPSAGWLVKGDITVNPAVTGMVGLFYSEGALGITTGSTGVAATDVGLTISGLLIGRKITLQRLYAPADNSPAEQITFDGRAVINPPPGLTDVVKGLPALREVIP